MPTPARLDELHVILDGPRHKPRSAMDRRSDGRGESKDQGIALGVVPVDVRVGVTT